MSSLYFLFSFILLGWGFLFSKCLKCDLTEGIFNAVAFLGSCMFLSFLFNISQFVALSLLVIGGYFYLYLLYLILKKKIPKIDYLTILCFLILIWVSLAISYEVKFRSIDDFSFWGAISKYLFTFHQLPANADYIQANFLTYVPGMASFHYLLFTLTHHYSQALGYFAQGMVLISAMIVFFNPRSISQSIAYLSIWVILFTLFYGTVFARMEVDAYVAAYLLTITWLIYKKSDSPQLIIFPIIFLSLIKEIGILFSYLALACVLVQEKRNAKIWCITIITGTALLITKGFWGWHVHKYGFHSFSHAISLATLKAAFNPFDPSYHPIQIIYLKTILLSNFDYLIKAPYVIVYLLLAAFWLRQAKQPEMIHFKRIMMLYTICTILYLLLLYALQAIVFNTGASDPKILDFQRYYHMLLLPWLCLAIFASLEVSNTQLYRPFNTISIIASIIAIIFLIGGKIERQKKIYNPNQLYQLYTLINQASTPFSDRPWSICLIDPPKPEHQLVIPLTYFFMPHRLFLYPTSQQLATCELKLRWQRGKDHVVSALVSKE